MSSHAKGGHQSTHSTAGPRGSSSRGSEGVQRKGLNEGGERKYVTELGSSEATTQEERRRLAEEWKYAGQAKAGYVTGLGSSEAITQEEQWRLAEEWKYSGPGRLDGRPEYMDWGDREDATTIKPHIGTQPRQSRYTASGAELRTAGGSSAGGAIGAGSAMTNPPLAPSTSLPVIHKGDLLESRAGRLRERESRVRGAYARSLDPPKRNVESEGHGGAL